MTIRDEFETIGFALAAFGMAFAGTMTALLTMFPFGFYPIATTPVGPLWAAVLPTAFVALFAWLLRRNERARLHVIPISFAAFVGGILSFYFFQPLGLTSILFLPALLVYPVTLLAGFALDRPRLTLGEVSLHGLASVALYGVFALPQLAVGLRWIDFTGCDGCDPAQASLAAAILFLFAVVVTVGAALRYVPSPGGGRDPVLLEESSPR